MHLRDFVFAVAAVSLASLSVSSGQVPKAVNPPPFDDAYQINFLANLNAGEGYVDISNSGALNANAFGPASGSAGRICVNVYAFSPDEREISCCSCLVTPNALVHLAAKADLIANAMPIAPPTSLVVKLLATVPGAAGVPGTNTQSSFGGSDCNPAFPFTAENLAPGMVAWAATLHPVPNPGWTAKPLPTFGVVQTQFVSKPLSAGELAKLTNLCQIATGNGSGTGVCNACTLGGAGAAKK
jgi:hypothetical protein